MCIRDSLSTAVVGLMMIYVIGTPISAMQAGITSFLTSMSGSSIAVLGIIFGLLYWDLGGPFSKVLYAFAIGMVAEGVYEPMAAVMVCGMVPPLGIALATFVRPALWNQDQREAGKEMCIRDRHRGVRNPESGGQYPGRDGDVPRLF